MYILYPIPIECTLCKYIQQPYSTSYPCILTPTTLYSNSILVFYCPIPGIIPFNPRILTSIPGILSVSSLVYLHHTWTHILTRVLIPNWYHPSTYVPSLYHHLLPVSLSNHLQISTYGILVHVYFLFTLHVLDGALIQ